MILREILGNDKVKDIIEKTIETNNVSHSYMFIGPDGVGKKLFAQVFAKMILCDSENKLSCNKCNSCIKFDSNNHPDYYELEPDGNSIKIEQIRQLQNMIYEKPIQSNKKVYIINNAETMTIAASNCLLKTLEEPPQYAVIILIVENESIMLSTIKSRCLKINFQKIDNQKVKEYFEKKYNEKISDIQLQYLNGSIGKTCILEKNKKFYDEAEKIFCNIEETNILDVLNKLDVLYKNKEDIFEILDYIIVVLYKAEKDDSRCFDRIKKVEEVKNKIKNSNNYDMSIDSLLFGIWED